MKKEKRVQIMSNPCIRNLARPGLAGAKAWLESRGESGHKPGSGRVGQGIKNPGKPRPQGQPGLARPRLTGAKIGTAWHEEKEKPWPAWLGMAGAGQGRPGPNSGQACRGTSASLARIKLNWRAAYFRPGCIGSGFKY